MNISKGAQGGEKNLPDQAHVGQRADLYSPRTAEVTHDAVQRDHAISSKLKPRLHRGSRSAWAGGVRSLGFCESGSRPFIFGTWLAYN